MTRTHPWIGFVLVLALSASPATADDDEPVRIVALGDSITKGVRPGVKEDETFAARLQARLRGEGVRCEVVNVGIGGERADQALARLAKDVLMRQPRIVAVMYGTNDSYVDQGRTESRLTPDEYRANLRRIVEALRSVGVQPVLMTEPRWGDKAPPNGVGEHPNARLERYMEVCRDVARQTRTPLVDHFAHWSKRAAEGFDVGSWTTDQCHPNPTGHEVLVETMLPTLRALARPSERPERRPAASNHENPPVSRVQRHDETPKEVQIDGSTVSMDSLAGASG